MAALVDLIVISIVTVTITVTITILLLLYCYYYIVTIILFTIILLLLLYCYYYTVTITVTITVPVAFVTGTGSWCGQGRQGMGRSLPTRGILGFGRLSTRIATKIRGRPARRASKLASVQFPFDGMEEAKDVSTRQKLPITVASKAKSALEWSIVLQIIAPTKQQECSKSFE